MKKVIITIFILIIFITVGFFVYKDAMVKQYKVDNNVLKNIIISKDINVNVIPILESNHISVANVKFKNIFLDYQSTSQKQNGFKAKKYNQNGYEVESFDLEITTNLYTQITTIDNFIDKLDKEFIVSYFKSNNINNDVELLLYLRNYKYENTNIFSSIEKLKENYLISNLVPIISYKGELSLLKGSHIGIVNYLENGVSIEISKGTKLYKITFLGENVTVSRIEDLLRYFIIS